MEIAEIMEFSKNFYIEIHETDTGIGALELLVDKTAELFFRNMDPI
ncbi:MAG: hypothetical protein U5N58_06445 [Actinomycetota bacterium]|nr:hypothetical protein [Actinomycetota bacterium]